VEARSDFEKSNESCSRTTLRGNVEIVPPDFSIAVSIQQSLVIGEGRRVKKLGKSVRKTETYMKREKSLRDPI
jgi:hypothetical protein